MPAQPSPLSRNVEAMLSVERELVACPEPVRRRAYARARLAIGQARGRFEAPRLFGVGRAFRLLAAVALFTSSAMAAWLLLAPDSASKQFHTLTSATLPPVAPPQTQAPKQQRATLPTTPASGALSKTPPSSSVTAPPAAISTPPHSPNRQNRAVQELRLLDQARRAVVEGRFQTALTRLRRHAAAFPNSQLSEEREALRVRALKGAGLADQAGKAASDFESRYPNSVLAPQMQESGKNPH